MAMSLSGKRKLITAIVVFFGIVVAWIALTLTLLNEEWLKAKISQYANEAYGAEVTLDTIQINIPRGEAVVQEVVLANKKDRAQVDASIGTLSLGFNYLPLLRKELDVVSVEIDGLDVRVEMEQPPERAPRPMLERVEELGARLLFDFIIAPFVDLIVESIEILFGDPGYHISVGHIDVSNARVDVVVKRVDADPFHAVIDDLKYEVWDIEPRGTMDFLRAANVEANLRLGGQGATYSQQLAGSTKSIALQRVNLGAIDALLKQRDMLVIKEGAMNVGMTSRRDYWQTEVALTDLQLTKNDEAEHDDFMFIPVSKVIEYVGQKEGSVTLSFQIEGDRLAGSEDLAQAAFAVWEGMWQEILMQTGSATAQEWKKKSEEKLRSLFKLSTGNDDPSDVSAE